MTINQVQCAAAPAFDVAAANPPAPGLVAMASGSSLQDTINLLGGGAGGGPLDGAEPRGALPRWFRGGAWAQLGERSNWVVRTRSCAPRRRCWSGRPRWCKDESRTTALSLVMQLRASSVSPPSPGCGPACWRSRRYAAQRGTAGDGRHRAVGRSAGERDGGRPADARGDSLA